MRKYAYVLMLIFVLGLFVACDYTLDGDVVQVGDTVRFGNHSWLVLSVCDNNTALLITENIVAVNAFHGTWDLDITWEKSDLRTYLNSTFLYTFSQDELTRILPQEIHTPNNKWYGTRGGNDTTDYLFLLSIEEVVRYFGDSGQLSNPAPPQYGIRQWSLSDEYNSARITADENGTVGRWWLRSPGFDYDFIAFIMEDGSIRIDGGNATLDEGGIRPSLLLDLSR